MQSVNQPISCRPVSNTALLKDKKLLSNLFSLLIDAHYQTSQDDLQRLLDAPEIQCFILTRGSTLLGVAQIVEEGGHCLSKLADNITNCSRRVKGHLVAQNIASSYNTTSFLLTRQWRLSRIAIAPEHQRKGLGKTLIDYVESQAKKQRVTFLSTSFGCNTNILKFWYSNEFSLVKLSAKPEVSSGEHSGICIKALTNSALELSQFIQKAFHSELLYQMDKNFQWMSEDILLQILLVRPTAGTDTCTHVETLKQFAIGKRPYFTCKRLLKEYLIAKPICASKLPPQEQTLLVAALLQNLTDNNLCAKFGLSGKKQIERALKTCFEKMLSNQ